MVKEYVFWGLFVLVLIGIVVSLWDRHRRSLTVRELEAAYRAGVATANKSAADHTATTPAKPATSPLEVAFDPDATRVHLRDASTNNTPAALNRDTASLPTEKTARLVCVGGNQKDHSFSVTAAGITVGRDPKSDVVINDSRASHHHAWIGIIDHQAVLRDLGSTNGTFLNVAINSPVREVVLKPGDTIFFGGHGRDQFRFIVD